MPRVRVVNVRGLPPADRAGVVYVGRRWAGVRGVKKKPGDQTVVWPAHELANPFRLPMHASDAERAACIAAYTAWLTARPSLDADLAGLWAATDGGRLPLGCWCAPDSCHADVLAELLHRRYTEDCP